MADNERRTVPIEEALQRIGDGEHIHTFMSGPGMLLGADHDRDSLVAAMRAHGVEESGRAASAMGHTLVIVEYPLPDGRTTPLFIEAALGKPMVATR